MLPFFLSIGDIIRYLELSFQFLHDCGHSLIFNFVQVEQSFLKLNMLHLEYKYVAQEHKRTNYIQSYVDGQMNRNKSNQNSRSEIYQLVRV